MPVNRKEFPWFNLNKNLIYLDSAATSLKPIDVIQEVVRYLSLETYNSHNTDSSHTYKTKIMYNETKIKLAKYFGTNEKNIAFTPGATASLNIIALGLKSKIEKNDEILMSYFEHSSNILPFMDLAKDRMAKIKYINCKSLYLSESDIINSISSKTKLVTFANASNLIGKKINAEKISKNIKKKYPDILICIDATQYAPTRKMNLKNSKIDFLVCSAHKMMGPTGIGMLYVSDAMLDYLEPVIVGGGMNLEVFPESYLPLNGIEKFEFGTLNLEGIYGWNASLAYYEKIDLVEEERRLWDLKFYLEDLLKGINNIKILNPKLKSNILLFSFAGVPGQDIAHYLSEKNIIIRSGLSCAKLFKYSINESDILRISMHFYTNKSDLDSLVIALKNYKKGDELIGLT